MIKNYFGLLLLCSVSVLQAQTTPLVDVQISQSARICDANSCTSLAASFPEIRSTENYLVSAVTYNPFPFEGGTEIAVPPPPQNDDFWSPVFTLPFDFGFYGNVYHNLLIGSNGCLTFNTSGVGTTPFSASGWNTSSDVMLPNPNFPNAAQPIPNAIFGVFQDYSFQGRNPVTSGINYYIVDTGAHAAPNRAFVLNFNQLPIFPANASGTAGLQTSQIVLHETTNIIEVNVKRRVPYIGWEDGRGVIGIQDADGLRATVPDARNIGAWTAINESYRFTPNGTLANTQVTWFANGILEGIGNPINTCVSAPSTAYTAQVRYIFAHGSLLNLSQDYTVQVGGLIVSNPQDLLFCSNAAPQTVDLTVNEATVLAGLNPSYYDVDYYYTLTAAENHNSEKITNPTAFAFNGTNQTVYMRITDIVAEGCHTVAPFRVGFYDPTPTGAGEQFFITGQTLDDLEVTGNQIVWYDGSESTTILPGNTLLQDATTYYAASAIPNTCQPKNTQENRLAVTVHRLLETMGFDKSTLKVYPNPTNAILNVSYAENIGGITVYNTIGQIVIAEKPEQKSVQIDLSSVNTGIYFVKLSSGNKTTTVKVVKN